MQEATMREVAASPSRGSIKILTFYGLFMLLRS